MDINHNQVVYIPKGEHDGLHELPQQQELEGSTEIEHTLYSHTNCISPEMNSFQKLEYIYQHFQDNEKIYVSDPDSPTYETDNTLYPHINNNIEYGLFEDFINSYYLDCQVKDDFKCDQECYTETQGNQQDQPLTPCTHAYDHITQHINNLEDPMQQNTLYTPEEDASLFVSNTAAQCAYNITKGVPNSDTILENKSKIISPIGIHSQSKHNYRNVFGDSNIQYIMTSIMVMHSLSKTNMQHYYNRNYKIHIGVYTILLQPKVTKYLQKWMLRQCDMQCIFQVIRRPLQKSIRFHTR